MNKAVTLNPDQSEWKVKLAGALLQAGQRRVNEQSIKFSSEPKVDHPEVYFLQSRLKEGRSAYQSLQKSLILKPSTKSALNNFGLWNLIAEKKFDALIWYQRALISEPNMLPFNGTTLLGCWQMAISKMAGLQQNAGT